MSKDRDKIVSLMVKESQEISLITKQLRKAMPYRFPKGYMNWEELSNLIAMQLASCGNENIVRQFAQLEDKAGYFNLHRYSLWAVQKAPIYCISREVFEALLNTNINEEIIRNLQISLPTMIILLPNGALSSTEGAVDNIVIHASDLKHPEHSQGEGFGIKVKHTTHEQEIVIHSATVDTGSISWLTGFAIEDGKIVSNGKNRLGILNVDDNDREFIETLKKIALMTYIIFQSNPEMIDEVSEKEIPKCVGKGFSPQPKQKYIRPRIIRVPKDKKGKAEGISREGSHASKRTHWRRSHYRTIETKDGLPKLVYVRATIVNPN